MARFNFGADLASFVILDPATQVNVVRTQPSATGSVYAARTGGSPLTDLLDSAGAAATTISSNTSGYVNRFQGPDGYTDLWADFGGGSRFHLMTIDGVGTQVGTVGSPADVALKAIYARKAVFHPRDFGGVGDGTADDTAALQACIDAVIGGNVAGGASVGRNVKGIMSLDGGALRLNKWKITAPLQIYSVLGFILQGDGEECQIVVSGALTKALDINGSYFGVYENFSVIGATTADTADTVIGLEWNSATANRSTSANKFRNIQVRNLKYKICFGYANANPSAQVDNNTTWHCVATGQWTAGENTWWQSGFKSGNGTFGNVLGHHFYGCGAVANRYNYHANAISSFNVIGGSAGAGEVDFYLQNIGAEVAIEKIRSEVSQRLMVTGTSSAATEVAIRDVLFNSSNVPGDNQVIQWGYGGCLIIDNVVFSGTVTAPIYYVNSSAARIASVLINGGASNRAAPTLVQSVGVNAPFTAVFRGYQQTSGGQVIATWSELTTTRAGVLKPTPGVTIQTGNYTIPSTEDTTVFNGTSLTATLPDPSTVAAGCVLRASNVNSSALTVNTSGSLAAPVITLGTTASSGGTFAAGTYFWKVTATNALGETLASNEITATLVLNGTQIINWTAIPGAAGYKVYRATTTGGEGTTPALVATLGAVVTYTDTGTAVAAGAVPGSNTAARTIAGASTGSVAQWATGRYCSDGGQWLTV